MKDIGLALPWVAFWLVVALFIWCEHKQYMAGHNTFFWHHKTDAEKKIQELKTKESVE